MPEVSIAIIFGTFLLVVIACVLLAIFFSKPEAIRQLEEHHKTNDNVYYKKNNLLQLLNIIRSEPRYMRRYGDDYNKYRRILQAVVNSEVDKYADYATNPDTFVGLKEFFVGMARDPRYSEHDISLNHPSDWQEVYAKFNLSRYDARMRAEKILSGKSTEDPELLLMLYEADVIMLPERLVNQLYKLRARCA